MIISKSFLNAKLLVSVSIIFSFFTFGCADNTTDPVIDPPETLLLKGFTQYNEGSENSLIFDFEYSDNKLKKVLSSNNNISGVSETIFTYNSNGIDNVTISVPFDKSITKLQFEYNGNNLSKITETENGILMNSTYYNYTNGKLSSVSRARYNRETVDDSVYYYDFTNGRPSFREYFNNFVNTEKGLQLFQKEKFVYQNGNMIEKYELDIEKNKWQLREKRTFNNEKIAFASIVDFVLLLDVAPYIPGNIDKNDFLTYESYYNYCNDQSYEEAQLSSKDTYIYKRESNGRIKTIEMINEEYCGGSPANNNINLRY